MSRISVMHAFSVIYCPNLESFTITQSQWELLQPRHIIQRDMNTGGVIPVTLGIVLLTRGLLFDHSPLDRP